IDAQPLAWRPQGLKSNGALWEQRPLDLDHDESLICLTGSIVDLTHPGATSALLDSQEAVLNQSCADPDQCIGPVHGWFVLDEWRLTESYRPFIELPWFEDLQPIAPNAPSCVGLQGAA